MQLNIVSSRICVPPEADRRKSLRKGIRLPVLLNADNLTLPGRLIDIGSGGAQIEVRRTALKAHQPVTLICGILRVGASVVWVDGYHLGLRFIGSVPDAWLQPLHDRSKLIEIRRIVRQEIEGSAVNREATEHSM